MKKVAISVAPVYGKVTQLDPKKVAQDIIQCAKAGAGELHLHPRDRFGRLTDNLETFREIVDRVKSQVDIVVQVSPGASSQLTMEQKCVPLRYPDVEMTSMNMTSMNFGRQVRIVNPEDIDYLSKEIIETNTIPEVELFDLGDFYTFKMIDEIYKFPFKHLFNIGLGHEGRLPATPKALAAFLQFMPEDAVWNYTEIGRRDFKMITAAIGMGADGIRVGLEDSNYLDPTTQVENNAPIVERTAKILQAMGAQPASPAEIRQKLNIEKCVAVTR